MGAYNEENPKHVRAKAVQEMVEWFHENFIDPEELLNDNEISYSFPGGGPFYAVEVLGHRYLRMYNDSWITKAVGTVEGGGVFEWAPSPEGAFYEAPDSDSEDLAPDEGGGEWSSLAVRVLARLDQIDRKLDELPTFPPNLGHNQPPQEIGTPPYSDEDRDEIGQAVSEARHAVTSPSPSADRLGRASQRLKVASEKIGQWLFEKFDLAVNESIKLGVKVAAFAALYNLLNHAATDLLTMAQAVVDKL